MAKKIYRQLEKLTSQHFNSHDFLDDLIAHHLKAQPEDISTNELTKIIDWLEIVVYLMFHDQKTIKKYLANVKKLTESDG